MSDIVDQRRRSVGLDFRVIILILVALLFVSIPVCWAASAVYGADPGVASDFFYAVFDLVYFGILLLPWLSLTGQAHLGPTERLERMCISWLCLAIGTALIWELPWIVFVRQIVAGKGQLWAYVWWAYMAGGDTRYAVADGSVQAMETAASTVAVIVLMLLWRRRVTRRFTDVQLLVLMAAMAGEFYGTVVYFLSEFYNGIPDLGGPGGIIIKFFGSNVFWLVMPLVLFVWAGRQLVGRRAVGPA
jgi:hypothetical protein